jgi:hypothetical protein
MRVWLAPKGINPTETSLPALDPLNANTNHLDLRPAGLRLFISEVCVRFAQRGSRVVGMAKNLLSARAITRVGRSTPS